jgi:hypothetical protein
LAFSEMAAALGRLPAIVEYKGGPRHEINVLVSYLVTNKSYG